MTGWKGKSGWRGFEKTGASEPATRLELAAQGTEAFTVTHDSVAAEKPVVETSKYSFWYDQNRALHDITMAMPEGKVTAIVGPSGCGKSTLLRSVNRLNDVIDGVRYAGDIMLNGDSIFGNTVNVTELRRRIGMVFQKSNPFPMSIFDNAVYPLKVDGVRKRQVLQDACERSLRKAGLWDEVQDRLGDSALRLSGGQQQRLCIARAITSQPEVLLMDEPCSDLDPMATGKIEDLMQELKRDHSVIIVTHNLQQASRVSDFTAFMYRGRLFEYGPTADIFTKPLLSETADYVTGRFG